MKDARDINPFGLRMPPDLRQKVEVAAKATGRSLNAELIHRIQASFEEGTTEKRLAAIEGALRAAGLVGKAKGKKRAG